MRRVVALLTLGGNGLGLVRDLTLAALFGAGVATDAFLAAWSVPETVSPLLLEGLMALIGIPYLARAVAAGRAGEAVARTLAPVLAVLVVVAMIVALAAEPLVALTVPGIADPELAADCVRLAAPTVPLLGAAGYLSALLRAHDQVIRPAAVYLAYNVGIISTMLVATPVWGIRAAAAGLSVGAATMCLIQLRPAWRLIGRPRLQRTTVRQWAPALALAVPLTCYLLARQGQTFVERWFASDLEPGAISQLNYAQKVGQVPGTVAVALALTSLALIARQAGAGRRAEAGDTVAAGLRTVLALVVPAAACLMVLAHPVVRVLFERGAFTAADSRDTASVLRVYVSGLPGQALVSVLVIAVAGLGLSRWLAPAAAGAGLVVTALVAAALGPALGVVGIAAADAAGIWVAALVLVAGVWRAFGPGRPGGTLTGVSRTAAAGAVAGAVAFAVLQLPLDALPWLQLVLGAGSALAAGLLAAVLLRADDVIGLLPGSLRARVSRSTPPLRSSSTGGPIP